MTSSAIPETSSRIDGTAQGQPDAVPLTDDEKMRYDQVVIRDELSDAQHTPSAVRTLSAKHLGRLIYALDDVSSVVEQHTAPYGSHRPSA